MSVKLNSKFKLGTARARRIYLVIALTLFPLLASEKASAQNATATILNGGLPGITLPFGGGAFTFDINMAATFTSVGIGYFLQSNDGNGFFSLTGQNTDGSPFQGGMPPFPEVLHPRNDFDLGGVIANPNQPLPPGSYFVSTMSLSYSASLAPGVYHIFFGDPTIVTDGNFSDHGVTANQFTVTIVPEPATTGLAVLGGVMLLAFVWRARRIMA